MIHHWRAIDDGSTGEDDDKSEGCVLSILFAMGSRPIMIIVGLL